MHCGLSQIHIARVGDTTLQDETAILDTLRRYQLANKCVLGLLVFLLLILY